LTDTWSYLFNEYTPGALPYLGSTSPPPPPFIPSDTSDRTWTGYHGSEVAFVFGEVSAATNYSASAVALSKTMIDYW